MFWIFLFSFFFISANFYVFFSILPFQIRFFYPKPQKKLQNDFQMLKHYFSLQVCLTLLQSFCLLVALHHFIIWLAPDALPATYWIKAKLYHSVLESDMTLNISNTNRISIFYSQNALGIMPYINFCPKPLLLF